MRAALSPSENWLDLEDVAYLYTGAHSATLHAAHRALNWAHRQHSRGPIGRENLYESELRSQAAIGSLAGISADSVAFVGDTSTAWNLIANGLEWTPGDNVVINEFEHPAVAFPFLRLKSQGLDVRVARRDADWRITPESIAALVDERTRAIAVSHVGYVNGYRHDISALSEIATQNDSALFVDWSHSFGVLPIDMTLCDIGVGASYKWLLGTYGVGIILWNRERLPDFVPGGAGWRSTVDFFTDERFAEIPLPTNAVRFRQGAPSFAGIAAIGASTEHLLDIGGDRIAEHALALAGKCMDGFAARGLTVITPKDPAEHAGNIAFVHPRGEEISRRLAERGVYVWGGDGRVRASCHVMTSEDDVDRFLTELDDIVPSLPPD